MSDGSIIRKTRDDSTIDELIEALRNWQDGTYEELDKLSDELMTHRERVAMLEGDQVDDGPEGCPWQARGQRPAR